MFKIIFRDRVNFTKNCFPALYFSGKMAYCTILFILTFLSIICYPHTIALADQVDTEIREPYPLLGSLLSNHGTVHFIAGVMIATVKLESQIYIENQLEIVFAKGLDILTLFRHGGIS